MSQNAKILPIIIFFLSWILPVEHALAAFSISATPYEGGYELRFGKVTKTEQRINKEVKIQITSDIGKQYRVYQELLEPLTSLDGKYIPWNSFKVFTLRGSNSYGTLEVEVERPVTEPPLAIYTSNAQGVSDSFIVIYGLADVEGISSGSYRGRIAYTLQPVDSSQSPQTDVLNVAIEVSQESKIELVTSTGTKTLQLKSIVRPEEMPAECSINIIGGLGNQYTIIQEASLPLKTIEGKELSKEAVLFSLSNGKKGTLKQIPDTQLDSRQILYASGMSGEADSLTISYRLGDIKNAKAGRYKGSISYIIEGPDTRAIENITLSVDIEERFELNVIPPIGGMMLFRDLKPRGEPRINEVEIEINTNLGFPYQVSQKAVSPLINREGNIIPSKYFTFSMEGGSSGGTLKYPVKSEFNGTDSVIFISNRQGDPDKFKIIYELSIPAEGVVSGDYSTNILYSLSEI